MIVVTPESAWIQNVGPVWTEDNSKDGGRKGFA